MELPTCINTLNIVHCLQVSTTTTTIKATYLTPPLADVSSFVLAVVVVPVAAVNKYRQTVFTVIVVWVTCEER